MSDKPMTTPQPDSLISKLEKLISHDDDWDNSYWNQSVQRCINIVRKHEAEQAALSQPKDVDELLSCPFNCGSEKQQIDYKPEILHERGSYYVSCGWCGACGEWQNSKDRAVSSWNSRSHLSQPKREYGWVLVGVDDKNRLCNLPKHGQRVLFQHDQGLYAGEFLDDERPSSYPDGEGVEGAFGFYDDKGNFFEAEHVRCWMPLDALPNPQQEILTLLQSDEAREKVENEIAKKRVQSRLSKKLFNVEFVQPCDDDKRAATAALNALVKMIKGE